MIKHGIIAAPKKGPSNDDIEVKLNELAYQAPDPLVSKSLEELDELEDEADDAVVAVYRYFVVLLVLCHLSLIYCMVCFAIAEKRGLQSFKREPLLLSLEP